MGPLEALDAEIARRRAELHKLLDARDVLASVFPARDAPGFTITPRPAPAEEIVEPKIELRKPPEPPPVSESPAGNAEPRRRPGPKRSKNRERVALLLFGESPLRTLEIQAKTGIPVGSMGDALNSPWFEKTGPGAKDPWRLTEKGLEAAKAIPPLPPDPAASAT